MKYNWDLEQIIQISFFDKFTHDFVTKLSIFEELFKNTGKNISPEEFKQLFELYIDLTTDISKIYSRAFLAEEIDNTDENIKYIKTKAINIYIEYQNKTRIFINWIKGKKTEHKLKLNYTKGKILFAYKPKLHYYFKRLRDVSKHTLDNKSEEIIAHKDITGNQSLLEIRSLIDTEQKYEAIINKKKKKFNTTSELANYFKDKDRKNRENAYTALYQEYKKNLTKYFSIYQSTVKDWTYEKNLRGFKSNISVRNFANDIKDCSVEILLNSCKTNKHIFLDFFELKRRTLGLKNFSRYDIYANHGKVEKKYSYDEAVQIVLSAFRNFNLEFYQIAKDFLSSEHIDIKPNDRKRQGAFCANVNININPFILLNHTNTVRDVFILAHELGHAIHYILTQNQTVLTQDAPLTLAETASTFSENLIFDYLYNREHDSNIKKVMLFDKISDSYATILRQAYFVLFEIEAHEILNKGILLSDFNNIYLKNLKNQFGKKISVPNIFKYEWSYIPHIVHEPFYCYAYPFGQLLALSLYEEYEENGSIFIPKFKRILSTGGSENPNNLLLREGFDINKDNFFSHGFRIIDKWVLELKKLL